MQITKAGSDYLAIQYEHAVDSGLDVDTMRHYLASIGIPARQPSCSTILTLPMPSPVTGPATPHRHHPTWQHWTLPSTAPGFPKPFKLSAKQTR